MTADTLVYSVCVKSRCKLCCVGVFGLYGIVALRDGVTEDKHLERFGVGSYLRAVIKTKLRNTALRRPREDDLYMLFALAERKILFNCDLFTAVAEVFGKLAYALVVRKNTESEVISRRTGSFANSECEIFAIRVKFKGNTRAGETFFVKIGSIVCCGWDFGRNPQLATCNSGCVLVFTQLEFE